MEKIEYKGYEIEVMECSDADSPREWSNLGTMVCSHKRYNLGDEHNFKASDYNSFEEMLADIKEEQGPVVSLPMYMFDHSGLTVNTIGYSDIDPQRWDWGQIGYIYVSYKKVCEENGWKKMSTSRIEKVKEWLNSEVKVYADYLAGYVYGYRIINPAGEEMDSCWSFYGYDNEKNGLLESARGYIDDEKAAA